jgi:benzoyl-CoA reductase/2-hydroxyglutaryl-CoA dehydratase subunit BcrC/BadD/HgdB
MADYFDDDFILLKHINEDANKAFNHIAEKYPQNLWMFDVQKIYWDEVYNAHANGRKLVYVNACAPIELIYAFGCVPFVLDMISTRVSTDIKLAGKYVDLAERHIAPSMCGIIKVDVGAIMSSDMPEKPDAFIYSTVPCDSSRVGMPALDKYLNVPTYTLDIPYRKDERGYRYIADQYKEVIVFLENLTGQKLDMNRLAEVLDISNKSAVLMEKIARLRRLKPCPLPGALLFLNQLIPCMAGNPAMLRCLEAQYKVGQFVVSKGMGATKKENFRVLWLQNMLWCNINILGWLEKQYGACVVMEAFGYQNRPLFEDLEDIDKICLTLAENALALPMIHGSSGPVEDYIRLVDEAAENYAPDLAMYVGHVGCKHTWASAKILKDILAEKYDIPMMSLDVDAIDRRYKGEDEIKAFLTEYMDTLVESRGAHIA